MLLNALVWQTHWPSWLTGKLGDTAAMVLAPQLLALPHAWLGGGRPPTAWAQALLPGALVAAGFAWVKTNPAANSALLDAGAAFGLP